MTINAYQHGIAKALGHELDYKTTTYDEFCQLIATELKQRKGQMPSVLRDINAEEGYNMTEVPDMLLHYLEHANEEDEELKAELKAELKVYEQEKEVTIGNRK
jgi:uncharacterized protein (DUF885 family)